MKAPTFRGKQRAPQERQPHFMMVENRMVAVDLPGGAETCPFCGDTGYDRPGLVNHIVNDCDSARVERESFAKTAARAREVALAGLKREGLINGG